MRDSSSPRRGERRLAGGKREARNPRTKFAPSRHPCGAMPQGFCLTSRKRRRVRIAPPGQAGRIERQRKFRAATLARETGRSVNLKRDSLFDLEQPPRLADQGGFASFSFLLDPPRLARRGYSHTLRRFLLVRQKPCGIAPAGCQGLSRLATGGGSLVLAHLRLISLHPSGVRQC